MINCVESAPNDGIPQKRAETYCECVWEEGIAQWGHEFSKEMNEKGPEVQEITKECSEKSLGLQTVDREKASAPKAPALPVYRFTLNTEPDGALVFHGDVRLGKTPYNLEIPEGEDFRTIKIKKKGYRSQEVVVNRNTPSPLQIKLRRLSKKRTIKTPKSKSKEPEVPLW